MKRLLLVPLLLTLLVGCSTKDKTYIERRDDCAETASGVIDIDAFIKKYKMGVNLPEGYKNNENSLEGKIELFVNFCRYYGGGGLGGR